MRSLPPALHSRRGEVSAARRRYLRHASPASSFAMSLVAAVAPAPIWRLTATLRLSSPSRSVVGMRPRQCRLGIPGGAARATFRTDTRVLMSWAAKPAPRMRAERLGFVQLVDRISRVG
jgi:hypothetical protein